MTIINRADGLGWDVLMSAAYGVTTRAIIKSPEGFVIVNGFKAPNTSIVRKTFREAVRAARNKEV